MAGMQVSAEMRHFLFNLRDRRQGPRKYLKCTLSAPGPASVYQEPTETSKQPIRTRCLSNVTGYQPIRDQYFLIRPVSASTCFFRAKAVAVQHKKQLIDTSTSIIYSLYAGGNSGVHPEIILDLKKTFSHALEQHLSPIDRNYYKCGDMTSFSSTKDLKLATPGYNTHLKCPFQPHEMTTCRHFHGPLFFTTQGKADECMLQTEWSCVIEDDLWCNGFSQCLWDECHCPGRDNNAVFTCPGLDHGCVTFTHVCDGHVDCPGGEDERACTGAVLERCWSQQAVYSEIYTNYNSRIWCETYVGDPEWECTRDVSGPELKCIGVNTDIDRSRDSNIECLMFLISFIMNPDANQDYPLSVICNDNCAGVSKETCGRVIRYGGLPAYRCQGSKEVIALEHLCDGQFSCPLKDDEQMCSKMFYCEENGTTSVNIKYTCDGKWDCKNGADECLNACIPGETSDVNNLIKPGIRYTLLSIFIILLISILVFFRRLTSVWQIPQRSLEHSIPQFLLILYSCCMAWYILIIMCMDLHYRGSFCVYYITWRAGILCQVLGTIFSFSTHGSFLVIIQMSLDSLRNMVWCTTDYQIGYSTAATHMFGSIVLAVLPLKGLGIFSTDIHFPQAIPFKTTPGAANASGIKSIFRVLNGSDTIATAEGEASDNIPPEMIEFLKNTTNTPEIYEHVTIGYYGRITPLCVGDIFSPMQGGGGKILYGLAILLALLTLVGYLVMHLVVNIAGLNEFITNRQAPKQQPALQIAEQKLGPQIAEQQPGPQIAEQQTGPQIAEQQLGPQITEQQPGPQIAEQQPVPQIAQQQPGIPQQPAQSSSMPIHVIAASKALAWIVVAASILNPNLALLETADHEGVYGLACFGSLVVTSTIDAIV
eukprot:sb/3461948/